jgi:hypothetical protein
MENLSEFRKRCIKSIKLFYQDNMIKESKRMYQIYLDHGGRLKFNTILKK